MSCPEIPPFVCKTPRLFIRPLAINDWQALSAIGGKQEVASMLITVSSPWPEKAVKQWMDNNQWTGMPGFRLAICLKSDELIGTIGLGGNPPGLAYFLDPVYWNKGYATEASWFFLEECFERFDLSTIGSAAFQDNIASWTVLEKLGFERTGAGEGKSPARSELAADYEYLLHQEVFSSLLEKAKKHYLS
jgi:[ribosomal protein S5]-alanine N-acetyltransferase